MKSKMHKGKERNFVRYFIQNRADPGLIKKEEYRLIIHSILKEGLENNSKNHHCLIVKNKLSINILFRGENILHLF